MHVYVVTACSSHFRPQAVVEPEGEEEGEEEEGGSDEDSSDEESKRTRFQEKKPPAPSIPSPEPQVTPGSFKGFSFKKRTAAKSQFRQRTSDFS